MFKFNYNIKKISCVFLYLLFLFTDLYATTTTFEDLPELPVAKKISELSLREKKLYLFGLNKFEVSFEQSENSLAQMKSRLKVWRSSSLRKNMERKVMRDFSSQNKIINYLPHYFKKVLEVNSAKHLKYKKYFFEDFTYLMDSLYKNLGNRKIKKINEEINRMQLEKYPIFPNFVNFIAYNKNKFRINKFPGVIKKGLEESYKDGKSIKKESLYDQKMFEILSQKETSDLNNIKSLIFIYNISNKEQTIELLLNKK